MLSILRRRESYRYLGIASTADMQPAILADCEHGLYCWCNRCSHNAVVPIKAVTRKLGERCPVPDTARHMVCSDCGSKDIAVRPNWPAVGVVAHH